MWSPPWSRRALGFGPRPEHVRVKTAQELNQFFHDAFGPRIDAGTEFFAALGLTLDFKPVLLKVLAEGTESMVQLYYSDISKVARTPGVVWVVLIHNHPSGSTVPSHEDVNLTDVASRKMFMSRDGFLWDHIITVADPDRHYSFRGDGKLRLGEDVVRAIMGAERSAG